MKLKLNIIPKYPDLLSKVQIVISDMTEINHLDYDWKIYFPYLEEKVY